jgi:predicted RNA-binding protein with PUA-like domain
MRSEPSVYSFADLERDGKTVWDGVRNAQARIFLEAMQPGHEVLFYHSQDGLAAVGVAKIVREAFPDPTDETGRWTAVEIAPVRRLGHPVSLAQLKANPKLAEMRMLRQFRLSVSPLTADEWAEILRMSEA